MPSESPAHRIEILPAPKELRRRPQKPQFVPPPPRQQHQQAQMVRSGIAAIRTTIATLTPEQRRAVFLKLESANPLPENELQRARVIPIRQEGKQLTVALALDPQLTALEQQVSRYEASTKTTPDHAALIANLTHSPTILSIDDRMSDTFKVEREDLLKKTWINVKLELSPLQPTDDSAEALRRSLDESFRKLRHALGSGVHGNVYDHLYDRYHRLITANVRVKNTLLRQMLDSPDWSFITWFDTLPRFKTLSQMLGDFDITGKTLNPPSATAPIICIIDTGVLARNALLRPAVRSGMEKSFHSDVPSSAVDEANHGTGVAGLAVYQTFEGKLTAQTFNPGAWIANARILDKHEQLGTGQLFAKVIEAAVRHFHKAGCRLFNLSVGDIDKPYRPRNPLDVAEMIDSLVSELDVVVVIAAGNLLPTDINGHRSAGLSYPKYLLTDSSKILDPAQAVNAVTVGSVAGTHRCVDANRKPFVFQGQPSPFTRSGPGINGYIKPELVEDGGNLVLDTAINRVVDDIGCKIVTTSNDLGKLLHRTVGTSFAAPKVAFLAARILQRLQEIPSPQGPFVPSANLIRAVLVNSATVDGDCEKLFDGEKGRAKYDWLHLCGYGQPSLPVAIDVQGNRSILIHQGQVEIDKIVYFSIPVPASLHKVGRKFHKRIRVTVAYDPPVRRSRTYQYCGTRMYWKLFRGDISPEDIYAAMSVEEGGTPTSDETPKELKGVLGSQRRSRSTVQHDIFCWSIHKESYSENFYTLAVVARRNWDTSAVNQRYAVAVNIEVDDPSVDIATTISQTVRQPIPIRVRR